jgi:hypothetical protein
MLRYDKPENEGNILKVRKSFKCPCPSREEMEDAGLSEKEITKIAGEAEKIANDIMDNPKKIDSEKSEKEQKKTKFEVVE